MKTAELTFGQIQERLKANDVLLADIAQTLDTNQTFVSDVAKGKKTSKRVATALALALRLPLCQVFGDKYEDFKNIKNKRQVRKQEIKKAILSNCYVPLPSRQGGNRNAN